MKFNRTIDKVRELNNWFYFPSIYNKSSKSFGRKRLNGFSILKRKIPSITTEQQQLSFPIIFS